MLQEKGKVIDLDEDALAEQKQRDAEEKTRKEEAEKAKNEGKLPFYGYFLAIWVGLWRRDSNHSNIYWHP